MTHEPTTEDQAALFGLDAGQLNAAPRPEELEGLDETKWAPLLSNLVAVLTTSRQRSGDDADTAFRTAQKDVVAIANYFGGRVIYLPMGKRLKLALRDIEIYRKFNGNNVPELAAEYGINEIHLYKIIRQQRARHVRLNQRRLWDD
jgi:Mor family transcriptional regulator